MKQFLTIFLSSTIIFANGQTTQPKATTVFYNSFSWSPDGTSLCFSVIVLDKGVFNKDHWEIGSIKIKNKHVNRITNNSADDDWAVYSPDGKRLAFQSTRDGNSQIYIMDADGNHLQRLSNNPFNEFHPDWSPDGKKILFVSDRDGNQEIYTMNTHGSEQTRLTASPFNEFNPQWSSKGKKILYYYDKGDNKDQLYIEDENGKNNTKISSDSTHNYYPSWLPDSEHIIYTINGDVWRMSVKDTSQKQELLKGVSYAKYSPDGKKIAFKKGGWPSAEIWICDSNGKNAYQITDAQMMIDLFTVAAK